MKGTLFGPRNELENAAQVYLFFLMHFCGEPARKDTCVTYPTPLHHFLYPTMSPTLHHHVRPVLGAYPYLPTALVFVGICLRSNYDTSILLVTYTIPTPQSETPICSTTKLPHQGLLYLWLRCSLPPSPRHPIPSYPIPPSPFI